MSGNIGGLYQPDGIAAVAGDLAGLFAVGGLVAAIAVIAAVSICDGLIAMEMAAGAWFGRAMVGLIAGILAGIVAGVVGGTRHTASMQATLRGGRWRAAAWDAVDAMQMCAEGVGSMQSFLRWFSAGRSAGRVSLCGVTTRNNVPARSIAHDWDVVCVFSRFFLVENSPITRRKLVGLSFLARARRAVMGRVWDGDMGMLLTLDPTMLEERWYPGPHATGLWSPFGFTSLSIDDIYLREGKQDAKRRTGLRLHTGDAVIWWAGARSADLMPHVASGHILVCSSL